MTSRRSSTPKRKTATRSRRPPAGRRSAKATKYVYYFGDGRADGNGTMKGLLGGKGANLAEMTRIGLPVPPGFTISTEVCTYFYAHKRTYPSAMQPQVEEGVRRMERIMRTAAIQDVLVLHWQGHRGHRVLTTDRTTRASAAR